MAPQIIPSVPTSPSTYGFFESLPRELRDKIYDDLNRKFEFSKNKLRLRTTTQFVALRLVSRQFKLEYDERYRRDERMTHFEVFQFGEVDASPKPSLRDLMSRAVTMSAESSICDVAVGPPNCNGIPRFISSAEQIIKLKKDMPHLRSIRLNMTVLHAECLLDLTPYIAWDKAPLDLFEVTFVGGGCSADKEENHKVLASYSRQNGLVEDHEAIKQHEECMRAHESSA